MDNPQVFLDANVLIYALDQTGDHYTKAVAAIQKLQRDNYELCTSHHVIEEVIHVARSVGGIKLTAVVNEIAKIPGLVLVEPDANLAFAERFSELGDKYNMDVNDALLLQIILDAGINKMLTYDRKFALQSEKLGIKQISF